MLSRRVLMPRCHQVVKKTVVERSQRHGSVLAGEIRRFATSSNPENSVEYEIDLISLKKTPKQRYGELKLSHLDGFRKSLMEDANKSTSAWESIWQDPLDYKQLGKDDINGYLDFTERYVAELNVFLDFIRFSYDGKIKDFDQLTSCEMINSLYIFKSAYSNGKIKAVNKYNVRSYTYMFEGLMKHLSHDKNFPELLSKELMPVVEDRKVMIGLYKEGILNYIDELKALEQQFDLKSVSLDEIVTGINRILEQSKDILRDIQNYDKTFFKVLVQVMRYRWLLTLIEKYPNFKVKYIKLIIADPDAADISVKVNQMNGNSQKLEDAKSKCEAEIFLLKFALPDLKPNNFYDLAESLHNSAIKQDNELIISTAQNVIECFIPLYGEGVLAVGDIGWFKNKEITRIEAFDNFSENFQAAVAYNVGILENIDSVRYLKHEMKGNFHEKSPENIIQQLNSLIDSFKGAEFIRTDLLTLKTQLSRFFVLAKRDISFLDMITEDKVKFAIIDYVQTSNSVNKNTKDQKRDESKPTCTTLDYEKLSEFQHELDFIQRSYMNSFKFSHTSAANVILVLDTVINDFNEGLKVKDIELKRLEMLKSGLNKHFERFNNDTKILDEVSSHHSRNKEYVQIPDDLDLHQFSKELSLFREKDLQKVYKESSAQEVNNLLDRRIDEVYNGLVVNRDSAITSSNVNHFVRLSKRLVHLFRINNNETAILDALIQNQDVFNSMEKIISSKKTDKPKYVQIPDDLEIHKFISELKILREDEFKRPFSSISASELNTELDRRIDEIYNEKGNSNPESRISKKNVVDFMRLSKRLTRLFDINGGNTSILDTLLQSQTVFDQVEKKIKSKTKNEVKGKKYAQIPESLDIHKFSKELMMLRDELGSDYKTYKASEIIKYVNERIQSLSADVSSADSGNFTPAHFPELVKLLRRLEELFRINGENTEVLDVLLNSQTVFDSFEKSLTDRKSRKKTYVQLPDDFRLEEYVDKLIDLKYSIGTDYKSTTSEQVLKKTEEMIESETDVPSKVSLRKLYRNLKNLFKINNNNTSVLDNVILNLEQFVKFESNKAIKSLGEKDTRTSLIAKHSDLINDNIEEIEEFLVNSNLVGKDGIWKISKNDFRNLIDNYKQSLATDTPDYKDKSIIADQLKEFNDLIECYPNFLQQLYEIKKNDPDFKLSQTDVEEIYKAIIEIIEYEGTNSSDGKFNEQSRLMDHSSHKIPSNLEHKLENTLNEFSSKGEKISNINYTSKDGITSLNKNQSAADVDAEILKPKNASDKENQDTELKTIILDALNTHATEIQKEIQNLENLTTEDIRKGYRVMKGRNKDKKGSAGPLKSDLEVNTPFLKTFLENAKEEKRQEKETKFRESKAYEWSKGMCTSQRSLESNNFFNPIYESIPKLSSEKPNDLLFPNLRKRKSKDVKKEYILLNLEGRVVYSDVNPLGDVSKPEDIFSIFGKFSKQDSDKFIRVSRRYQSRGWRLIGGRNISNEQKYLILSREVSGHKPRTGVFTKLKTIFAVTGAVFVGLIGLNSWLDDPREIERARLVIPQVAPDSSENTDDKTVDHKNVVLGDTTETNSQSFIKHLLWR